MMDRSETNLRAYSMYVFFQNLLFWTPVFFLLFSHYLSLPDVLLLEGIYYFAVVLFEVPSGVLSDRVGRKPVLLISAVMGVVAYTVFAFAETFLGFCAAQVIFAVSISFNSGSDTSWHHDTIVAMGREDEFMSREGKIVRLGLMAAAIGGVLGGFIASYDLSWAYIASAIGSMAALMSVLVMREPPREHGVVSLKTQFKGIGATLSADRKLVWYGLAMVVLIVLNHLPYELFQPYIAKSIQIGQTPTSVWTGMHTTTALLIAAGVSGRAASLARRFGVGVLVLSAEVSTVVLLVLMSVVYSPAIVGVLLFRSVPRGLATAPLNAAMAARLRSGQKATFLSLVSLGGRLVFGLVLLGLSWVGSRPLGAGLVHVLAVASVISAMLVVPLWFSRPLHDNGLKNR